jgi:hypothetical protein
MIYGESKLYPLKSYKCRRHMYYIENYASKFVKFTFYATDMIVSIKKRLQYIKGRVSCQCVKFKKKEIEKFYQITWIYQLIHKIVSVGTQNSIS